MISIKRLRLLALSVASLVALTFSNGLHAQLPSSVDIGLYEATPGTLEVRMTSNGADFDEVVSGIVFTIRWETSSGATLGGVNQQIGPFGIGWCPLTTASVSANPGGVITNGIYSYQNYTEIGVSQLSSCTFGAGYSWPNGTEVVLCEIPYSGATGCTNFEITNDAFAASQNYEYFCSLNGIDLTGVPSPSTVSVGCPADCNGVIGGPDVPGAPCDDGDPTTGMDVYQADCTCAGMLIDCEGVAGGTDLPGQPCDDGDATTGMDVYQSDCTCAGLLIDCEGVAGGTDLPGQPCDDGDATTGMDVYQSDCTCAGMLIDCLGVAGGPALPGTACDDGDPATSGDVYQADCTCAGSAVDCNGVPGGPAVPGTPCDDGDVTTGMDVYQADCTCAGMLIDCLGVPGGAALPGTACDDGDPATSGDVYQADCTCAGSAVDCNGVPGGPDVPGAPCDDGDATTGMDVYQADCTCAGMLIDCLGVPGGSALPGTTCDDGDPATSGDVYQADCTCSGTAAPDCNGVPGGPDVPGAPCDDGDATTGMDVYQADCTCAGMLIDCLGVPGGAALPGTACDDGDPATSGDVYQADCTCAGSAAPDCNGVPGGPDVPGAPCDDGDATTGMDVYQADCTCAGMLIDCLGVPGGSALPGTACDDGDPNTSSDVYQSDCSCAGTVGGGCTDNEVLLELMTDANGNETTWEIVASGSSVAICSGGPYTDNSTITEACCLPDGCYDLLVFDAMGDGMYNGAMGGYKLTQAVGGSRIIDNTMDGQFGATSAIMGGTSWCVPLGNDRLNHFLCDKLDYDVNDFIVAHSNPAVAAEFGIGNQSDDGFQFWIFDPDGTFNRRIFRSHANPSIGAPPGAYAANHLSLLSLNSVQPIPQNIRLNVRVRSRVNGTYAEFGPACVIMVDPAAANDPCATTELITSPSNQYFSCGVSKEFGTTDFVSAWPVQGANRYQFEFTNGASGYLRRIAYSTYHCQLSWSALPLLAGTTYDVRVRASKDNGATYCPWGGSCQVSIIAPPVVSNRIGEAALAEMQVFPNPLRGNDLNIVIEEADRTATKAQLQLMDAYGKLVFTETVAIADGELRYVLDVSPAQANGLFFLNVVIGETAYQQKVIRY